MHASEEKSKRGRPAKGRTQPEYFSMRVNSDFWPQIDSWRHVWSDNPSRAEVIRRLLGQPKRIVTGVK